MDSGEASQILAKALSDYTSREQSEHGEGSPILGGKFSVAKKGASDPIIKFAEALCLA